MGAKKYGLTDQEYESFLLISGGDNTGNATFEETMATWCRQYLLMTQSMKDRFWLLFDDVMDVNECFEILKSEAL